MTSPQIVFGYHGCTQETASQILSGKIKDLSPSEGDDHWLGKGIYFWENAPDRAAEWAIEWSLNNAQETNHLLNESSPPAILGAVIDLRRCLNLLDVSGHLSLKKAEAFISEMIDKGMRISPQNEQDYHRLDCLAINAINESPKEFSTDAPYDTVRGCFPEGRRVTLYSAIYSKAHIQIAVRNPDCITGYFRIKNEAELLDHAKRRLLERYETEFKLLDLDLKNKLEKLFLQYEDAISMFSHEGESFDIAKTAIETYFDKQQKEISKKLETSKRKLTNRKKRLEKNLSN